MITAIGPRLAFFASLFAALALSSGAATADIKSYKKYTAVVTVISPPRLSLASIEQMRHPGKTVRVSIIEVPNEVCRGGNLVDATIAFTKAFSGEYSDMPIPDGGPREALDALNRFYQNRMVVEVGSDRNPCRAEKLRAEGYRPLSRTRKVPAGNGSVELVMWVMKIGEAEQNYGTASATFTVVGVPSAAVFDTRKHNVTLRFNVEDISFSVDNEPTGRAAKQQSLQLQNVFKGKVRKNAVTLGKWLNKTRHLLSKEDMVKVITAGVGQTLDFNKKLNVMWAGEKRTISVAIRVVAGETIVEFEGALGNQ